MSARSRKQNSKPNTVPFGAMGYYEDPDIDLDPLKQQPRKSKVLQKRKSTLDEFQSLDSSLWSIRPQKFIVEWFSHIKQKFSTADENKDDSNLQKHFHILSHLCEKTEQIKKCEKINPQMKMKAKKAVEKVQSDLLEETDITFSQPSALDDMKEFYSIDPKSRESELLKKASNTDIGLYQGLLRHSATSTMLQVCLEFSDADISSWFSKDLSFLHWLVYLLIAVFYPILEILSICPPRSVFRKLRIVLSTYPISYFVGWGSYLWTTILLFAYQFWNGESYIQRRSKASSLQSFAS